MSARKDLQDTLNHRQPARIPVDFGATAVTGIHVLCMEKLRAYYHLEPRPVKVVEPYQMLGLMEPDLMEAMGVTVAGVISPGNLFGFNNLPPYKPFTTPWGQEVLVPEEFRTIRGNDGYVYIYPCGDTTVPPSGRMPADGYFFDTIIRQEPIDEDNLNYRDNLEEFTPLDEPTLQYFESEAKRLDDLGYGAIGGLPGTGLGDIAWVPGPNLKHPKGIRDVAEWYISTVARADYVHQVFEEQTKIALENLPKLYKALGSSVDAVFVCGTDFGTQNSQFCSVSAFEKLYAPYYSQINNWVHANTTWKTFKHSCGSIAALMPAMIECGFDIINPVQCSATNMNPEFLKKEFGKDIVFWGGGIDTQHTLAFGSPEEVYKEALDRCEVFGRDGGFVFNAIHNIQANTRVENVAAMVKALMDYNK
jgi:hypothetical protein